MNPTVNPIRTAIAGIGGFGSSHHGVAYQLEQEGIVKLLATCDPRVSSLGEVLENFHFSQRAVQVFEDFDEMLREYEGKLDLLAISTPIGFHNAMHEAAVTRNIACYLEKPPTLDPEELQAMIERDKSAKFKTQVGFAYIVEPWRHALKKRLDEFGPVQRVTFHGLSQRDNLYFNRANWAGKLLLGDQLILDSCFGNAMSHHIHNILFFAGTKGLFHWGEIKEVKTELYRANPIESTDTIFATATTTDGVELRVACSHATDESGYFCEEILHEKARVTIFPNKSFTIHFHDGRIEAHTLTRPDSILENNFRHYLAYLQGKEERPLTTLYDSKPFVEWNALNFLSSKNIYLLPETERALVPSLRSQDIPAWTIPHLESIQKNFLETGTFPSQQSPNWNATSKTVTPQHLPELRNHVKTQRCPEPVA